MKPLCLFIIILAQKTQKTIKIQATKLETCARRFPHIEEILSTSQKLHMAKTSKIIDNQEEMNKNSKAVFFLIYSMKIPQMFVHVSSSDYKACIVHST